MYQNFEILLTKFQQNNLKSLYHTFHDLHSKFESKQSYTQLGGLFNYYDVTHPNFSLAKMAKIAKIAYVIVFSNLELKKMHYSKALLTKRRHDSLHNIVPA